MAEKPDDKEIQAAVILYLLDMGHEDLANALMACKLTLHYELTLSYHDENDDFDEDNEFAYLEIAGRQPHLQKLTANRRHGNLDAVNDTIYDALRQVMPDSSRLDNIPIDIRVQAALGASVDYQQELRHLVESAGVDEPAIGGLRVRREGHEYQLKPISIFPIGTFERDAHLCFVLMPFAPGFQPIYERGIKPAIEAQSLTCQRGDDILQAGDIIGQIWGSLIQARLVIADLTGANGNVLYELGLAHMMGHQAILLAQDISSVPFDLRQQRHIIYSPTESGLQKLAADLGQAIQAMLA